MDMRSRVTENRLKLYYFLLAILGGIVIYFSMLLNIKKAGQGVAIEMLVAGFVFILSQNKFKAGLLVIGCISIIEFIVYNLYCSNWSATICQRNLVVISATSIIFFGIFWLALLVSKVIINIFGLDKTRRR